VGPPARPTANNNNNNNKNTSNNNQKYNSNKIALNRIGLWFRHRFSPVWNQGCKQAKEAESGERKSEGEKITLSRRKFSVVRFEPAEKISKQKMSQMNSSLEEPTRRNSGVQSEPIKRLVAHKGPIRRSWIQ